MFWRNHTIEGELNSTKTWGHFISVQYYSGIVMISESQNNSNQWIPHCRVFEGMGPNPELMDWRLYDHVYSFTPTKDAQKQQFMGSNHSMTPKWKTATI